MKIRLDAAFSIERWQEIGLFAQKSLIVSAKAEAIEPFECVVVAPKMRRVAGTGDRTEEHRIVFDLHLTYSPTAWAQVGNAVADLGSIEWNLGAVNPPLPLDKVTN